MMCTNIRSHVYQYRRETMVIQSRVGPDENTLLKLPTSRPSLRCLLIHSHTVLLINLLLPLSLLLAAPTQHFKFKLQGVTFQIPLLFFGERYANIFVHWCRCRISWCGLLIRRSYGWNWVSFLILNPKSHPRKWF